MWRGSRLLADAFCVFLTTGMTDQGIALTTTEISSLPMRGFSTEGYHPLSRHRVRVITQAHVQASNRAGARRVHTQGFVPRSRVALCARRSSAPASRTCASLPRGYSPRRRGCGGPTAPWTSTETPSGSHTLRR